MDEKDWGIIQAGPADLGEPLMRRLYSFYGDKRLCDVTLRAGDYAVDAHKIILALSSEYFNAMFSGNWSESSGSEIVLKDLTPNGLKAVVEFIYCGKFYFYDEHLQDIVSAVHHCQLSTALKLCEEYLIKKINESNLVDLFYISDLFGLKILREHVTDFIAKNYMPSFTERTTGLKPPIVEADSKLFKSALFDWKDGPHSCGFGPFVGMSCAVKWAEHTQERDRYLPELLSYFAERELDTVELKEIVEYCRSPTRGREEKTEDTTLVATLDGEMACFDIASKTWKKLLRCPRTDEIYQDWGTAVLQNILYVCGGLGSKTSDGTSNECYSYDPCLDYWFPMSPMLKPRRSFGLVALKGELLAMGGMTGDYVLEDSVETYNPSLNCWSMGKSLPETLTGHAAVAYEDKVYITGGVNEDEGLGIESVYCYDPETKTWSKKKDMIEGRFCHYLVAHKDHLYVFGGKDDSDQLHATHITDPLVECYSIESDTWIGIDPYQYPKELGLYGVCSTGSSLFVLADGWFSEEGNQVVERSERTGAWQIATLDTETYKVSKLFQTKCRNGTELHLFHSMNIPSCVMKYMLPLQDLNE